MYFSSCLITWAHMNGFFLPPLPISTILVEPCCEARLTETGDVCVTLGSDRHCSLGTELNTVQLSIFSHRFMSIAGTPTEKMGGGDTTVGNVAHLRSIALCLQNRWVEFSKGPPSPPTSRNASTSPVLCSDQMAV